MENETWEKYLFRCFDFNKKIFILYACYNWKLLITNIDCHERLFAIIEENNERVIVIMKIHLR